MKLTPRERLAFLYPGVRKMGLALFVADDKRLKHAAVGSIPLSATEAVLSTFGPDLVYVEPYREGPWRASEYRVPDGTSVRFVHPEWSKRHSGLPPWRVRAGPLALHAWRMGYHELARRQRYRRTPEIVRYSRQWLDQHRRP